MLREYIRFAIKSMQKRKTSTMIAIMGLALTISTIAFFFTIFHRLTVNEGIMENGDRIVFNSFSQQYIKSTNSSNGRRSNYGFIKAGIESIEGLEATTITYSAINSHWKNNVRVEADLGYVDAGFDDVFNLEFIHGSFFSVEDSENEAKVIVISEEKAIELFGRSDVLNETIDVFAEDYKIIGVYETIPDIYATPMTGSGFDEMIPLSLDPFKNRAIETDVTSYRYISAILVKESYSVDAVKQRIRENAASYKVYNDRILHAMPFILSDFVLGELEMWDGQVLNQPIRIVITALFVLSTILLIICTINISNLQSSVVLNRSLELGVRMSFGAYLKSIFSQFLVEIILLASFSGITAMLLLVIELRFLSLVSFLSTTDFSLNLANISLILILSFIISFLTILVPMVRISRHRPVDALKGVIL